jgi:protein-tyrosine-phosphatase/DNA-binding HxlR family transcriptional regulator
MADDQLQERAHRARLHAALGDPTRLAIVDTLTLGEASPSELQELLEMPSNLMAHHVRTLERVGLVERSRSEGDRRRTYLSLVPRALDALRTPTPRGAVRVVFVCTANSARSQLAAALWSVESAVPATSAGTHPAATIHPGTLAVARRRNLTLTPAAPRHVHDVVQPSDVIITVCDSAHEELGAVPGSVHWSVADPARSATDAAFDHTVDDLTARIARTAAVIRPAAGCDVS